MLRSIDICYCRPRAPQWYVHLQEDVDYQGCNGGVCFCDDRDACNAGVHIQENVSIILIVFSVFQSFH